MTDALEARRREHRVRNALVLLYVAAIVAGVAMWRAEAPGTSELGLLAIPLFLALGVGVAAVALGYFLSVLIAAALLRTSLSAWIITPLAFAAGLAGGVAILFWLPRVLA
jgi:hypothetical protein